MLIDSHSHLEMPDFKMDLEEVIDRAKASGVGYIFTVGTEKKDWERTLEIVNSHPSIYAILGVHPHNAGEIDDQTYPTLKELCKSEKVRAYGEIGLDFYRNRSPRDIQLGRFREQIGLARDLHLPIVVHDREAHRETLEILKSEKAEECGGIIHCFSGDDEMAKKCIDMGFLISVPGTITYRNAEGYREIIRRIPLESLLVETDAPFLTPHPHRGRRNEPAYVALVAVKISELHNIDQEVAAQVTGLNAAKLFDWGANP